MATPSKIKIMLSSRCNDLFPSSGKGAKSLSKIREELKERIEAATMLEQSLWTEKLWIYDLQTNKHFTLKEDPLKRSDLSPRLLLGEF